ncbi:MAG: SsrA-binding protein SmpB [Phycisphaerae bacterium]|jgi:SsrA-binding protein
MASKKDKSADNKGQVAVNKKAYYNFELTDKIEAGVSLVGSEVKSLREHNADLNGSYAKIIGEECFLLGATIAIYEQAGDNNHEPTRKRKLLLHRREILKIKTKLEQRGYTLVPLRIYFNHRGLAKIELSLACGKRQYDKRRTIAQREQKKDIDRQMKKYRK